MKKKLLATLGLGLFLGLAVVAVCCLAFADDWPRFHGPGGSGVSLEKRPLPVTWSETENLKWKAKLPGPGSSSPIVIGKRVIVTCWTGYAVDPDQESGNEKDLRRHVLCFDSDSGKVLWDQEVVPVLPKIPTRASSPNTGTPRTRRCPMAKGSTFSSAKRACWPSIWMERCCGRRMSAPGRARCTGAPRPAPSCIRTW